MIGILCVSFGDALTEFNNKLQLPVINNNTVENGILYSQKTAA